MRKIYDYFLILVILLKVIYMISTIRLKFNRTQNTQRNKILFNISEGLMFVLLLIIFFPGNKGVVKINKREKFIFFALGIMGLLHLKW